MGGHVVAMYSYRRVSVDRADSHVGPKASYFLVSFSVVYRYTLLFVHLEKAPPAKKDENWGAPFRCAVDIFTSRLVYRIRVYISMPPEVIGGRLFGGLRPFSCSAGFAIWHIFQIIFLLSRYRNIKFPASRYRNYKFLVSRYNNIWHLTIFDTFWSYAVYF